MMSVDAFLAIPRRDGGSVSAPLLNCYGRQQTCAPSHLVRPTPLAIRCLAQQFQHSWVINPPTAQVAGRYVSETGTKRTENTTARLCVGPPRMSRAGCTRTVNEP